MLQRSPWLLRPTPVWLFAAIIIVPTALSFLVLETEAPPGYDWWLYGHGFDLWMQSGTPYEPQTQAWNPCLVTPYLYPPSSWPLMIVAKVVPYQLLGLAALPLLARPPRLILAPLAAALLLVGLPSGLFLGNVNVVMIGLLVLSFERGRVGGLAFAIAVAIKGYPIVLMPLLWGDRERLRWFAGVLAILVVSGTILLPSGWYDVGVSLLTQGPHCDLSLNPFGFLGPLRVLPAAVLVCVGWWLRSPTTTLAGATFMTGVVTRHYLPTLAATLRGEPLPAQNRQRRGD